MKIAIISTSCYRKNGGVAQETWQSALEFSRRGHEVHLITLLDYLEAYQFPPSSLQIHRIKINRLSMYEYKGIDVNVSVYRRVVTAIKLIAYAIKVISAIHSISPDIVQTKGVMDAIPAYITKKLYKIPYTLTLHGNPADTGSNMVGIPALSKITKKYWRYLPQFRAADEVVSLTSQSSSSILKIFGRSAVIIPDGVDINIFTPDFLKRCDTKISLELISIGMLNVMKGFEYVIRAMSSIVKIIPHAHLTIIGDGPLCDHHIQLIKELMLENSVTLSGRLPHRQIVESLQSSHILLLPSVEEGFSLVLLEAMACGLPIVGTPVSVVPDIIAEWHNGYLVPYRDPEAIAEAVVRMYSAGELDNFSTRSLDAAKNYSWGVVAEKYLNVFRSVIQHYEK